MLSSLLTLLVACGASAGVPLTDQARCARQASTENLVAYHARARMLVTMGWQPLVAPAIMTTQDSRVVSSVRANPSGS
ncbi:MAG: hypothetical protein H6970_11390 [Gammaproteobacteria bacterium]|nr:hypothetical protein [Gammaproteobacteria bacterium]MCP5425653.1 hypothetical protein [Gammaproteobacteria bacterium]